MAEVTQAELKDAIRIAGDMEKALYAFRDLTKFLTIYSKALADEEKSGPRRDAIRRDIESLEQKAQMAKGLVESLAGEVAEARMARRNREEAAEKLSAERIAGFEKLSAEAQVKFEDLRKQRGLEIQKLNEELEGKRTELVSIKADIELLKKRLGA